jgi:repressor LexA
MLTNDEQEVYDALTKSIELNGFAPSLREMEADVGFCFVSIRKHLISLEKKGFIRRIPKRTRAIAILRRPDNGAVAA